MKKKAGKGALFAAIVAAAVVIAGAGGIAWYMHALQSGGAFLEGTRVNGIDVSGKTPAEAAEVFREDLEGGQVVLTEDGEEVFRAALPALGCSLDADALEESLTGLMDGEKTDIGSVVRGLRQGNDLTVQVPCTVDEEAFAEAVRADALLVPRRENENAKILYYEKEKECRIKPEVQGTELKDQDLQAWLRGEIGAALGIPAGEDAGGGAVSGTQEPAAAGTQAADKPEEAEKAPQGSTQAPAEAVPAGNGYDIIRAIPASLYIPPEKTADDKKLREKCEVLNRYAGESVTYVFGDKTEILDFKKIMNWIRIRDGRAEVKEDKVKAYVRKLAEKYETRYMERTFTTTWGNTVTFPPGLNEYGYTILEDQEAAQLAQDILSGEPVEREPVYQTLGPWGDPLFLKRSGTDDLAGTYVEVSISAQHMWYYIDGALFIESDVVTGDITEDQGTATGVFPLAFKKSPETLRGGEGKKKYETVVQYWMPFYEGQGLHDAWWKTVFGGTEYIGNGSHGCVNLPSWVAESVYNNIVPGTAIIIYY